MIKKRKRGDFWKKISKKQRSIIMRNLANKRWSKVSKKGRSIYGKMMSIAKKKKLSTVNGIVKK